MRLAVLIYINLFPDPADDGADDRPVVPADGDDLSDCVRMIGYLRAPAVYAKRQSESTAPRAKPPCARRRERAVDELLGSGGDVHYGQRVGQEEHKKKELI